MRNKYMNSLSAMQVVEFLQLPHIPLQGRVLIKIIQHTTIKSLEGNVNFHFSHTKFTSHPVSTLFRLHSVSYLHEELDMLVFSQEVFAERHPLRHQVQEFLLPLQSLFPILFPSVSLGAIGGTRLRKGDYFSCLTSNAQHSEAWCMISI